MSDSQEHLERRLQGIVGADNASACQPWLPGTSLPAEITQARPADEGQARELLRLAAADGLRVLPCGAGSKLGLEVPREKASFAISTERLSGIIALEPADGTLTAWAGTPMVDLVHAVASAGRRLTPNITSTRATLGGAIATAETGADRLRYGPLRDQLLGMRALLSAEISSKSGGRLVKNVAGYDLHRAHCGGRGRLGLILEATLRLHPSLAIEQHFTQAVDNVRQGLALAESVLASTGRPLGVRILASKEGTSLHIHLGGREDVVEQEKAQLAISCGALEPSKPIQLGQPMLSVQSLRSSALKAAEWVADARAKLSLDATLVLDPGIAVASLAHESAPISRLQLAQLPPCPSQLQVVLPSDPMREAATGVAQLEAAVQRALDPLGIFA
jgi:hypothetical protein